MKQLDLIPDENTMMTLAQARQYIEQGRAEGVNCPCCSKLVKSYTRKLNANMAAGLIWLVRQFEKQGNGEFVDVANDAPREMVRSNQISSLKYWGLVEPADQIVENGHKRGSGLWRPTKNGIDFAYNRKKVESHATLADDTCLGLSGSTSITDALKDKFNYGDLITA